MIKLSAKLFILHKYLRKEGLGREASLIRALIKFAEDEEIKQELISKAKEQILKLRAIREDRPMNEHKARGLASQYFKVNEELINDEAAFFAELIKVDNEADLIAYLRGQKPQKTKKEFELDKAVGLFSDKNVQEEFRGILTEDTNIRTENIAWIAKIYKQALTGGEAHSVADIVSLVTALQRANILNINEFEDYSEARERLEEIAYEGNSKAAYYESIRERALEPDSTYVVHEDDRWKIVHPGTTVSAQWWGRDTDFCISSRSENQFYYYAIDNSIYPFIFIDKAAESNDKMRKFTLAYDGSHDPKVMSSSESTMTNANNRNISLEEIKGALKDKYNEFIAKIEKYVNSRRQTLAEENMQKIMRRMPNMSLDEFNKYKVEILSHDDAQNHLVESGSPQVIRKLFNSSEIISEIIEEDIAIIAEREDLPKGIRQEAVKILDSIDIIRSVSGPESFPLSKQVSLAKSKYRLVRKMLSESKHLTSEKAQIILAKDEDVTVRRYLAYNSSLASEKAQLILVKDEDVTVRRYLAYNSSLASEKAQLILVQDDDLENNSLAGNSALTPNVQRALFADDIMIHKRLAENPSLIPDIQVALAKGSDETREALVENKSLSFDAQIILASDENVEIRVELAKVNPLDSSAQITLAGDKSLDVKVLLASNESLTSEEAQLILVNNNPFQVMKALAKNSSLNSNTQLILAKIREPMIREILAKNSSLAHNVQLVLTEDGPKVRTALAGNEAIAEDVQLILAGDRDFEVKRSLAYNHFLTSEEAQLILTRSLDPRLLRYLARNRSLTSEGARKILIQQGYRLNPRVGGAAKSVSQESLEEKTKERVAKLLKTLVVRNELELVEGYDANNIPEELISGTINRLNHYSIQVMRQGRFEARQDFAARKAGVLSEWLLEQPQVEELYLSDHDLSTVLIYMKLF
jgi:hypothetical protein